jgi:hypothetical protein
MDKTDCEKLLEDESLAVRVETPIPYNRLLDLLTSAFEGGSNYWIDFVHNKEGEDWDKLPKGGFQYVQEVPFLGGTLLIEPNENPGTPKVPGVRTKLQRRDEEPYKEEVWVLNLEALERGIKTMAALKHGEGGHHWPNFLNDHADAETGDVFLQCCLFGEIVFG